jgi:hypothetical protein
MTATANRRTAARAGRRAPVRRTVLALGIAAIAATWLPFAFLYVNTLSTRIAASKATPAALTATAAGGAPASALTPVTTRVS